MRSARCDRERRKDQAQEHIQAAYWQLRYPTCAMRAWPGTRSGSGTSTLALRGFAHARDLINISG